MLFPITHENASSRRFPWVTLAIVVTCFVAFVATLFAMVPYRETLTEAASRALAFHDEHPYLQLAPPLDRIAHARALQTSRASPSFAPPRSEEVAAQQVELDALCAEVARVIDESPIRRWGYVPRKNNWLGLVTSQFMHAGWLHLGFNMWFLWLCGCNLEDKWGRLVFVPFYLSAGVVAALAHKLAWPESDVACVGASGAIAGAMGAFLVSFTTTRIRFFWFYFLRWGTFTAPAYVMLPLWLGEQVLYGVMSRSSEGGVAYWAHVGGFAYGVAFALALRASGIERRLDDAVEAKITVGADPRLVRAGELIDQGRALDALAMLEGLAGEKPSSVDVQLETLRGAKAAGDATREARAYARLVDAYMNEGALQTSADLYAEAQMIGVHEQIPPAVRLRLAEQLEGAEQTARARTIVDPLLRGGIVDDIAARAAVLGARLACATGRRDDARALYIAARESPFSTPELDAVIDRALVDLGT